MSEKRKGRRESESVAGIVKIRTGKPVLSGRRGRKNIENKFKLKIMQKRSEFQNVVEKIDALSPLKTLSRGYSIMEKNGKIVKSKKELNIGDEVNIKLYEGTTKAKII